jgi:hypothetical protein
VLSSYCRSWMMMSDGIGSPLKNFVAVSKVSGPKRGFDSITAEAQPSTIACTAPLVPSTETIFTSPAFLPAPLSAVIAPSAISSFSP